MDKFNTYSPLWSRYNVTIKGGVPTLHPSAGAQTVATATATVVEVNAGYPKGAGFQPPLTRALSDAGELYLGPFGVAVVLA